MANWRGKKDDFEFIVKVTPVWILNEFWVND